MIEFEEAVEMLDGTSIEKAVRNMHAFFCSVEESIIPFSEKEGVSCPKGCGTCCEKFLPDITKLESLYLAAYISFSENKDELISRLGNAVEQKEGPCPLYDEKNEKHCMCYEARPLICRLFAQSCFPGKNGEKKFSHCHLNTDFKGPYKVEGDNVPIMGTFGQMMLNIEENDSMTEFLPGRVLKDIELIEFYKKLRSKN